MNALALALVLLSACLCALLYRLSARQKQAHEHLRKSQTRLAAALAESEANHSLLSAVFAAQTEPLLVYGADGAVVRTNPAAHRTWGFDPTGWHHSEVMAKLGISPEPGPSLTQRALTGEATVNSEVKAAQRVLEMSSAPMRDSEGRIIGAVVVAHDVTRRHRMRSALEMMVRDLEAALQEKTILLKEVHHRVKNNLAVISSVLAMKAGATPIAEARQALEDSQMRIRSIALIHEHLYGLDNLDSINFAGYAEELLRELAEILAIEPWRVAVSSDLAPVELAVDLAVPCGLILHELVTNAFKHAFPGNRRGEVRVSFRECEPGTLQLTVEDNGIGFELRSPEALAGGKSLGLRIVQILARQLDATFQQESAPGARFVLRFPSRLH
ncbi:MAG TPA: histidine kinase dimerization/phosphoacceptor domain -containing protein [Bryobacteraceae bacterium]|nr:histidine kinase dimerization/phosphoacceptor domain -containing protein [Bryobacteraceae bacterium]